jgi:hypothetical protein
MFGKEYRREGEKLRNLLKDSWPPDSGRERISFLKRLKLILQPDHPGLLCIPGKVKNGNGISHDRLDAAKWRARGVLATVAAYCLIIIAIGVTVLGIKYIFFVPLKGDGVTDPGINGIKAEGTMTDGVWSEDQKRFVYRFMDIEITNDKRLTLAQLTEKINDNYPAYRQVTITGMKQIDTYEEEDEGMLYKIYVFLLDGYWDINKNNTSTGEGGISGMK